MPLAQELLIKMDVVKGDFIKLNINNKIFYRIFAARSATSSFSKHSNQNFILFCGIRGPIFSTIPRNFCVLIPRGALFSE